MPEIFPFRAVKYQDGTDLALVTAPPYDVITPQEAAALRLLHPENVINLSLGGDHALTEISPDADDKYSVAGGLFRNWLGTGVLVKDPQESFFIYSISYSHDGRRHQTAGLVAALHLEPFGTGGILPHEQTIAGPKSDRLNLMRTSRANFEPLWFFAAQPLQGWGELTGRTLESRPMSQMTDDGGAVHALWRISPGSASEIVEQIARIPIVMADGHHRYETAISYRDERREKDGPGPWDATLAFISDTAEYRPALLGTHRLVYGIDRAQLPDMQPFEGNLGGLAKVVADSGPGTIGVASAGGLWTVKSLAGLDTLFLAEEIIGPQAAEVRYEHDLARVAGAVEGGATAFLIAPVPLDVVAQEAAAGHRLPPKTTLFWPKPRTGFVMRDLEPDAIP